MPNKLVPFCDDDLGKCHDTFKKLNEVLKWTYKQTTDVIASTKLLFQQAAVRSKAS